MTCELVERFKIDMTPHFQLVGLNRLVGGAVEAEEAFPRARLFSCSLLEQHIATKMPDSTDEVAHRQKLGYGAEISTSYRNPEIAARELCIMREKLMQ